MSSKVFLGKFLLSNIEKVKSSLFNVEEPLDKSKNDISLVSINSFRIRDAIICYLNSMLKMKFTEYLFLTDNVDSPYLKIFSKLPVKVIKTRSLKNMFDINLFLNEELVNYINTEYFLYNYVDGTIVFENSWTDEFFEYDYIGAPWSSEVMKMFNNITFLSETYKFYPRFAVGSGGFSFRSKKLLLAVKDRIAEFKMILEQCKYLEDISLCTVYRFVDYLKSRGISFSPIKLAKRFAYHFDFDDSFFDWFGVYSYSVLPFTDYLYSVELSKLVHKVYSLYSVNMTENEVKDFVDDIEIENKKYKLKDKKLRGIGKNLDYLSLGCSFDLKYRFLSQANKFEPFLDLSKKSISLCMVSDKDISVLIKPYLVSMAKVKFTKCLFFTTRDNYLKLFPFRSYIKIIVVPKFGSVMNYSMFLLKRLWDYIDTDYMLLIQEDSLILFQDNWYDEYLEYDYIGAPFPEVLMASRINDPSLAIKYPENAVGNGGFSLRSKRLMKLISKYDRLEEVVKRRGKREDVLLCGDKEILEIYDKEGIRIAPANIAANFSFENDTDFFVSTPFGMHGKKSSEFFLSGVDIYDMSVVLEERYGFSKESVKNIIFG